MNLVALSLRAQGNSPHRADAMTYIPEITGTLSQGAHPGSYNGQDAYEDKFIAHTLTAEGSDASEDGTGRGTPVVVTRTSQTGANGDNVWHDRTPTLDQSTATLAIHRAPNVRRLTPLECERLQGFPDGWTAGTSDSARYRMLGNAVCVPVAEWIGRRIVNVG